MTRRLGLGMLLVAGPLAVLAIGLIARTPQRPPALGPPLDPRALASPAPPPLALPPGGLHLRIPGRSVHNSTYLASVLLYELRVLLGAAAPSEPYGLPIRRVGAELYLDVAGLTAETRVLIQRVVAESSAEIDLDRVNAYMEAQYYEITRPFADLSVLRRAHPYRDNPDWLRIPVDSVTFHRRRVLHIEKDRIADALAAYFARGDRLIYPEATVIVAESLDKAGRFVDAEVLRKRGDGLWDFAVYDDAGRLAPEAVAFDENGERDPGTRGFKVPQTCAACHRIDRLDFSGDPEAPALAPIRGFFHRLPDRVPQIHLGPEYYDHLAFTQLTETQARVKDAVFGVYGSLLLSELAGRKRLGTLTDHDRVRYRRLQPLYPEVLTPLERIDSVMNVLGMRLLRVPPSGREARAGSPASDPDHQPDESRHPIEVPKALFMASHPVTNDVFRRFRPGHRSPVYEGVELDLRNGPAVGVSHDDAVAFVAWLNGRPEERQAGRTYRLPTEEEWEYAARSGDDRRFPWGDRWPPPPDSGNFGDETTGAAFKALNWPFLHGYDDRYPGTSPVASFAPNALFLYDMAGNVYQWTSSPYRAYPGAVAEGRIKPYGDGLRVVRGSSWADELPKVLRCAFRYPVAPATRSPFIGFRVVADIPTLQ